MMIAEKFAIYLHSDLLYGCKEKAEDNSNELCRTKKEVKKSTG